MKDMKGTGGYMRNERSQKFIAVQHTCSLNPIQSTQFQRTSKKKCCHVLPTKWHEQRLASSITLKMDKSEIRNAGNFERNEQGTAFFARGAKRFLSFNSMRLGVKETVSIIPSLPRDLGNEDHGSHKLCLEDWPRSLIFSVKCNAQIPSKTLTCGNCWIEGCRF